jgi:predicted nucleic acid-binding protein
MLLDSSVLIELFRKRNKQKTLFYRLAQKENDFFISSITSYEIGIGNRARHQNYWASISQHLTVLPFDKSCAEEAISIHFDLSQRNQLIDLADLFIAATAYAHNFPIATLNVKHFERVRGLRLFQIKDTF